MSLIRCPECGAEISELAPSCPRCGAPLRDTKPTVIERTAKRWKVMSVIGLSLAGLGMVSCSIRAMLPDSGNDVLSTPVMLLIVGGLILYAYAGIATWWHHG